MPEGNYKANLYEVDIPDDDGTNYIHWEKIISDRTLDSLIKLLKNEHPEEADKIVILPYGETGQNLYKRLSGGLGSPRAASEFLSRAGFVGISYPAQYTSGSRADNARNYVIFNPNDAKILSNTRYSLKEVNNRFNEQLATLTEENKDNVNFSLGMPSEILLAAGVDDKPMKLYGAKLWAKSLKHNYNVTDLQDLPIKVAYPIAVFKGSNNGSHAVLTEIKVGKNND